MCWSVRLMTSMDIIVEVNIFLCIIYHFICFLVVSCYYVMHEMIAYFLSFHVTCRGEFLLGDFLCP
jgi:hypothetical protein